MQDFAVSAAATQEEIGLDIASLFRGAIRLVMECVLDQEIREMGTSIIKARRPMEEAVPSR